MAGMILSVVTGWLSPVIAALGAAFLIISARIIKTDQLLSAFNLPILLVIAMALGIGRALELSGLAESASLLILEIASPHGTMVVLISIYILTNILTELITNNAAAVLVLPLALIIGVQLGLDPHAVAVTVAVAASASFLTPIGYQTNLMVLAAGRYEFRDFMRAGLPVTLLFLVVTILMVQLIWM
jgi:di/tricarboxylate transporter